MTSSSGPLQLSSVPTLLKLEVMGMRCCNLLNIFTLIEVKHVNVFTIFLLLFIEIATQIFVV